MSKIALITDSTAYLLPDQIEKFNTKTIPLYVHFGEEIFKDGIDINENNFFEKLKNAQKMPTTSQPSPADFMQVYKEAAKEADAIISIHISSKLSGTVSSAETAKNLLQSELKKAPEIYVIDSLSASSGLALQVSYAARAIKEGKPAGQIAEELDTLKNEIQLGFVVETLEYLYKGGRIGGASALFGSVLQVKPILHLVDGRIEPLEKVRTIKKAKKRLLTLAEEWANGRPVCVSITHAQSQEEANNIKDFINENFNVQEIFIVPMSPVIATHVGPGTVGVALYTMPN
jgi:DegV family protein with EDD domain